MGSEKDEPCGVGWGGSCPGGMTEEMEGDSVINFTQDCRLTCAPCWVFSREDDKLERIFSSFIFSSITLLSTSTLLQISIDHTTHT